LVQLTFKMKTKPNQTNAVLVGSIVAVFYQTIQFIFPTIKSS